MRSLRGCTRRPAERRAVEGALTGSKHSADGAPPTGVTGGVLLENDHPLTTDVAERIAELQILEVTYRSALSTTARVLQPSLTDFLRR